MTEPQPGTTIGEDGVVRCSWAAVDAEYRRYHDEEWGTELRGDRALFEKLSLEGFQAGLSWITILRRRPGFRQAFYDFDIDRVAGLGADDVEALMQNTAIIRNRAKILATISNARLVAAMVRDRHGAFDELLWSFQPQNRQPILAPAAVPAITAESTAMSTTLRGLGFRFVGPTTLYALMQSSGMVNDHILGCFRGPTAGQSANANS
jgi:DNA-3-methyladenine glycosylase I